MSSFLEFCSVVVEKKLPIIQPANKTPELPSWFSDHPEKHKSGRKRWIISSCRGLWNSIQQFQRIQNVSINQRQRQRQTSWFSNRPENTYSQFSGCREVKKCLNQSRHQCGYRGFSIGQKNANVIEDIEYYLSVKYRRIPFSGCRG